MTFIGVESTLVSVIMIYLVIVSIHACGTRIKDTLTTKMLSVFAMTKLEQSGS